MKKLLCVVVANAAMARVLERPSLTEPLAEVECLVHPESRMHASELENERPGHSRQGRANLAQRTDAKERERTEFARQIAHRLKEGVGANRFDGIVLFASNPFLGELLSHLDEGVRRLVTASHALDLTALALPDLRTRLRSELQP